MREMVCLMFPVSTAALVTATISWEQNQHIPVSSLHDTGNKEGRMMLAWGSDPSLGTFRPGLVAVLSFLDPDLRQTLLQGRGDRDGLLEMNIYAQGNVPSKDG